MFKNFFKLFVKSDDIQSLEKRYLSPTMDEYGFQKRYYMQSERLYKVFGEARTTLPNKVKLIVITDTHNSLYEEEIIDIVKKYPDYDLCLLLGDHSIGDIEKILANIPKEKIYALLGNHDSNYIETYNLNNLNGRIIEIGNTRLMGIQGSFRYKPSNFPSFSQEESVEFLNNRDVVDILISHDGPFDDTMVNNPAHQGLFGITYYLYKNKVKYNVHGHLHNDYRKTLLNGTNEICLYGVNYIELE